MSDTPPGCEDAARQLAAYIREHDVPFARGVLEEFFLRVLAVVRGLRVCDVPDHHEDRSLFAKGLFVLWAVVVDDALDRDADRTQLDGSTRWLSTQMHGGRMETPPTVAESILADAFESLEGRVDPAALQVLRFDMWEQVYGLHYEALIGATPALATTREYGRYSVLVASIKIYVDVDLALSGHALAGADYRRARAVCDELACAIKSASDIGTLGREIAEGSPNVVALRLRDAGFAVSDVDRDGSDARAALRQVIRATEVEAWHRLAQVRHGLSLPRDEALARLVNTVEGVVRAYCAGDPFVADGTSEPDSAKKVGTLCADVRTA